MRDIRNDREAGWGWIVGYAAFAAFLRIVPYYFVLNADLRWLWNFSAIGALGLFAGARFGSRVAYLAPLAAMLAADLLLIYPLSKLTPPQPAFYAVTPFVYACLALNVFLGRLLREKTSPVWIVPTALLTAEIFFFVSNFAEWAVGGWYARTFDDLIRCFILALPFFPNTLAGDLIYSVLFFGLFAAYQAVVQRQKVSQPA